MVKLEVKWNRRKKDDPTTFLDQISNQLRHVDHELDYSIQTVGGATITKDQLKLKHPVAVATNENGLPKREELWLAVHAWLTDLVTNQRVLSE